MSVARILVRILWVLTLLLVGGFPYVIDRGFLLTDIQGIILLLLLVSVLLTNFGMFDGVYNASNKRRALTLGISGFMGGLTFGIAWLSGSYGTPLILVVGIFGIVASYLFALIVNKVLDKYPKSFSAVFLVVIVVAVVPLVASIVYTHRAWLVVHPERAAEQLCTLTGVRIIVPPGGGREAEPFSGPRYKIPTDQAFCNLVYQTVHQPIVKKFQALKGTPEFDSWCNDFRTLDRFGTASIDGLSVNSKRLVTKCGLLN
ncbi:MAG: hypothetical protein WD200_02755 [Candidatus Andersenbacteria bacterium]